MAAHCSGCGEKIGLWKNRYNFKDYILCEKCFSRLSEGKRNYIENHRQGLETVSYHDLDILSEPNVQIKQTLHKILFYSEDGIFSEFDVRNGDEVPLPERTPTKMSSPVTEYTFSHWVGFENGLKATRDMNFHAKFKESSRIVEITFQSEGRTFQTLNLDSNSIIRIPDFTPVKESTLECEYVFIGWNGYKEGMVASDDMVFEAMFEERKRRYDIVFNIDNQTVSRKHEEFGKVIELPPIPTREPSDGYRYMFAGWDGYRPGMNVDGDRTFHGSFYRIALRHTITFNVDGEPFETMDVVEGKRVRTPSSTPRKSPDEEHEFTFKCWSGLEPESPVLSDATYEAVFEESVREYRITFIVENRVLREWTCPYGTPIEPMANEVAESVCPPEYEFIRWEGLTQGMTVEGDAAFRCVFLKRCTTHTATFKVEDEVHEIRELEHGSMILAPHDNPVIQSNPQYEYRFTGWSGLTDDAIITSDCEFQAMFERATVQYEVSFTNGDETISSESLPYGTEIVPPANPMKPSEESFVYEFRGWEGFHEHITVERDMSFKAVFIKKPRIHTATFIVDDVVYEVKELEHGSELTAPSMDPVKQPDHQYEYRFTGWSNLDDGAIITSDCEFQAMFEKLNRCYTVMFTDGERIVDERVLPHGTKIIPPKNPIKQSPDYRMYEFKGWDGFHEDVCVEEDVFFNAIFERKIPKYEARFKVDGELFEVKEFEDGFPIEPPVDLPSKQPDRQFEYEFKGWSGLSENSIIQSDCEFEALFERSVKKYRIVFVDESNIVYDEYLPYGTIIIPPSDPIKISTTESTYEFQGWTGYYDGIKSIRDTQFTSRYLKKPVIHKIIFTVRKEEYASILIEHGSMIKCPDNPPEMDDDAYDYHFNGWIGLGIDTKAESDMAFEASFYKILKNKTDEKRFPVMKAEDSPIRSIEKESAFKSPEDESLETTSCREKNSIDTVAEKTFYEIRFVCDNTILRYRIKKGDVIEKPTITPMKSPSFKYVFTFSKWTGFEEGMVATRDQYFIPEYTKSPRHYDITFKDENGTMIQTHKALYGDYVPEAPVINRDVSNSTFSHWKGYDKNLKVTKDLEFTAVFSKQECLIEFVNEGKTHHTDKLIRGSSIVCPPNPEKKADDHYEYRFSHWDGYKTGMTATSDCRFVAQCLKIPRTYAIKFIVDGTVFEEHAQYYGSTIRCPIGTPQKGINSGNWSFLKWGGLSDDTIVNKDMEFHAIFEKSGLRLSSRRPV